MEEHGFSRALRIGNENLPLCRRPARQRQRSAKEQFRCKLRAKVPKPKLQPTPVEKVRELNLKPSHKAVKDYYEALAQLGQLSISHEQAVRRAFEALLQVCCKQFKWQLVNEFNFMRPGRRPAKLDGVLIDGFRIRRGVWEAKDDSDDLKREIKTKLEDGYPSDNLLFQAPTRAVLVQKGKPSLNFDLTQPEELVRALKLFFEFTQPEIDEWERAVQDFGDRIPELAEALKQNIEKQKTTNERFTAAFANFVAICRQAINPNISEEAVEKMLIQHLLTERLFSRVFQNEDFVRRNVIAAELERVVDALTSKSFSRRSFLASLDHFYRAIERAAEAASTWEEKQRFMQTVYERFFQSFDRKIADTHGIVYTPEPIVNFMVRSVEEILKKEFGRSLSDRDVHILDPFVGTGTFITRIMREISGAALEYKYKNELHCNEIMLLPYYIASMNIEHEYFERTGKFDPFEGICLVDTFELAEPKQGGLQFVNAANTERVERQKRAPIFVIIGNPPYNVGQVDENEDNKNRKYPALDRRVADTYAHDSHASSVSKLNDPYVKAMRWASDRIGDDGVVAFVSNDSFIDQIAFDGVRANLEKEFSKLYVLDLGGNVRKNPKLSGTTHNVFGIQVGVSIELLIKRKANQKARIYHAAVASDWRKEQKYAYLNACKDTKLVTWTELLPDQHHTWLTASLRAEYDEFIALANKKTKADSSSPNVFSTFSLGVNTARDAWVYNFNRAQVLQAVSKTIEVYNSELARWLTAKRQDSQLDNFLLSDATKISWSEGLKLRLKRKSPIEFQKGAIREAIYRPFSKQFLYFDSQLLERTYQMHHVFPSSKSEQENRAIWCKIGTEVPFFCVGVRSIPNLLPQGGSQCFPFYAYDEDGSNRRENITDWALEQFRSHYNDKGITKWDIFHYVYAVLHHPEYRTRYAANLRRELPRIPFVPAVAGAPFKRDVRLSGGSSGFRRHPKFLRCVSRLRQSRQAPLRNSRQLRAAARVQAQANRESWRNHKLARGKNAPQQRQVHPPLQRLAHAQRHPAANL